MNGIDKIILIGVGLVCLDYATTGGQNTREFFKVFMHTHKTYRIKDSELYFGC